MQVQQQHQINFSIPESLGSKTMRCLQVHTQ